MNTTQAIGVLAIGIVIIGVGAFAFAVGAKYAYTAAANRAMHNADAYVKANCGQAAINNGFDLNLSLWPKNNLTNESVRFDT